MLEVSDSHAVELRLKIIVVGEVFSGKTSFIERYVSNKFITAYKPTVGVDFGMKTIQWDYTTRVKLQLWDCTGSDRCMTRIYYKNSVGALVLFDLNCRKSFERVVKWKKQIDDKVMLHDGRSIPCVLIANKCDVEPEISSLPSLGQFCEENKFCGYYLTSAKEGINVHESLHFLVEQIISDKEIREHLLKKKSAISSEIIIDKKSAIAKGCC